MGSDNVLRAAIYARISDAADRTPSKPTRGAQPAQERTKRVQTVNVATQVADGRAAAANLGAVVVEELVENDVTAGDPNLVRPKFERLMEGTLAGEWDVIVAYDQHRLLRLSTDMERVIGVCTVSGVRLVYTTGVPSDLESPEGKLFARFQAITGTYQVEKTRALVRRKMEANADAGVRLSGRAGFGFEADDGRSYRVVEAEAIEIKRAAERVLGGESLAAIAADWNARGIESRTGAQWYPSGIRRVLLAPRTAGLRVHRGQVIGPASWPAILDDDTFTHVARVLGDPRRRMVNDRSAKLLTGIIECGKCGRTMNHKFTHGAGKYYCRHCRARSIHGNDLERFVVRATIGYADDLALRQQLAVDPADDSSLTVLAELDEVKERLAALAARWGAGGLEPEEWDAARAVILARQRQLRAQLVSTEDASVMAPWAGESAALEAAWTSGQFSMVEKRALVRAAFKWIRIGAAVQGLGRFDPDRVTWKRP